MTFPATLNLIAWNCYVANDSDRVAHTLRVWAHRFRPDVFVLSEASTHADALATIEGYTLLQETPARARRKAGDVDDTGDVAILVADHAVIKRRWVARMARRWLVLSHRRWHTPHAYEIAVVKVRGKVWRVRGSHWPTHGFTGPNADAFAESARKSRRWLQRGTPAVDVGDLNEHATVLGTWFGPRYRVFGEGIDCAVTRGVRSCEVEELGKGGGDHYGRRYQFEGK